MIYAVYGTNIKKVRDKVSDMISAMQKKRPEASLFRMNQDNWSLSKSEELLSGQGLFDPKYIIVLDRILEKKDFSEEIIPKLKEMSEAEHVYVFVEEKISASNLKKLEKFSVKVENHDAVKVVEKSQPIVFKMTDAIGNGDRKMAWIYFREVVDSGVPAEEIHGALWWFYKSIFQAMNAQSADKAGLSPFVYKKSLSAGNVIGKEKLDEIMNRMVKIYHEAHRGNLDLNLALEQLVMGA